MKRFLLHLFFPQESNNHRSKLLHHTSLFCIVLFLLVAQVGIYQIKHALPDILGIAYSVSTKDLLLLTNLKREEKGLSPLTYNQQLEQAAKMKADYMFEKNYWAHNAPDGTTPWIFIEKSGYEYIYAGENLARGFTTAEETIDAWMASPTHRDNILSQNYTEIGFAIAPGTLNGEETVLVVEMFGSRTPLNAGMPQNKQQMIEITNAAAQSAQRANQLHVIGTTIKNTSLIQSLMAVKSIIFIVLAIVIGTLIIDMLLVERKNIVRLVGHNLDHILYLSAILVMIILYQVGVVL